MKSQQGINLTDDQMRRFICDGVLVLDSGVSESIHQTIYENIQWNATDNLGKSVPAGMYIYTIQAGEFRQTRKMVLLK